MSARPLPDEPLLSAAELAARIGSSRDTVYRHAASGKIPGFKVAGSWRFYLSEVVDAARPKPVNLWEQPARARNARRAS